MSATSTDVLIIGGGLIGLATAMHLQQSCPRLSVTLLEKSPAVAAQQSGHNSGVLHGGIYYEPGSLKAKLCVEGNRALDAFCKEHDILLVRCGKVVLASSEAQAARLTRLYERGTANGVPGLRLISSEELREIEPHAFAVTALRAPNSAIVDFPAVAAAYGEVFRSHGGRILLCTTFLSSVPERGAQQVTTSGGDFSARLVINCGGLHADRIARSMGNRPAVQVIPFRGEYYVLREDRRSLVRGLIYPVPDPALPFLDVHLTPKVSGEVEAGPNAILATHREGYRRSDFSARDVVETLGFPGFWRLVARNLGAGVNEINRSLRKSVFVRSLNRLVPAIVAQDLLPGGAGVRAMAVDRRGRMIDDFYIEEAPGAIHVLNAPSPAATSSFMIGKHIAHRARLRIDPD